MKNITIDEFLNVDIRVGTVIKSEEFPKARKPALKLWVDFGDEIGTLQTSAQITAHYTPETLIGRQVMGCINLGERNIAGFMSQFLCLGLSDSNDEIVLIKPDKIIPNGHKLH